jgi:hypothetical protein
MQERFKEIKSEVGKKVGGLVKVVFDIQPPLEEVMANFPHKKGCTRATPLKVVDSTKFVPVPYAGTLVASNNFIEVPYKYVECEECKVNARYSE